MNCQKTQEQRLTKDWRLLDAKDGLGLVQGFPTVRRCHNLWDFIGAFSNRNRPLEVAFISDDAILYRQ